MNDTIGNGRNDGWVRQQSPLARIRLTAVNSSMLAITSRTSREDIDVTAPYQRGSVWTDDQRRDLIRSILLGIPIGTIIRSARDTRHAGPMYRVVDGKQRVEAIWSFVDNNLAVPADWFPDDDLETVNADGTVTWDGLTRQGRRGFENLTVSITEFMPDIEWLEVEPGTGTHGSSYQFTIRQRTEPEVLEFEAMVFGLINSAGTPQTDETLAAAARIANPESSSI